MGEVYESAGRLGTVVRWFQQLHAQYKPDAQERKRVKPINITLPPGGSEPKRRGGCGCIKLANGNTSSCALPEGIGVYTSLNDEKLAPLSP